MRDQIINLQGQISVLANTVQEIVLGEFPDGYANALQDGKTKQKVYCLELDNISQQLQVLVTKAGKIIEKIDQEPNE